MSAFHFCLDPACWVMSGERVVDVPMVKVTLAETPHSPTDPDVVIRFDLPGGTHALGTLPLRVLAGAVAQMAEKVNARIAERTRAATARGNYGVN